MIDIKKLKEFLESEDSGLINVRVGEIIPDIDGVEFTLTAESFDGEPVDFDLFWADIDEWTEYCAEFVGDEYEVAVADVNPDQNQLTIRICPWETPEDYKVASLPTTEDLLKGELGLGGYSQDPSNPDAKYYIGPYKGKKYNN